jgi:hypothetical protein
LGLFCVWGLLFGFGGLWVFVVGGVWEVTQHPERPYTGTVMNGRDVYFQALYADRAVSQACIGCHNAHPDSPRRNFQMKDVMGGILIAIPMQP